MTLRNYVINTAHSKLLTKPDVSSSYPITNYVNCSRFSVTHRAFQVAVIVNVEPKSFNLAIKLKHWREAIGKEVTSLEENETWTLEDLPPRKRAIGSK